MTNAESLPARRTRLSLTRLAVVLACIAGLGMASVRVVSSALAAPSPPARTTFSAYVDVTATPTYPFETPSGPAQSSVILSFIVASPANPCTPSWGGYYTLAEAGTQLQLDRRLAQLRLTGGQAEVSFGGQRGPDLAEVCTDATALQQAYAAVIRHYQLRRIDLDVEGQALNEGADRRRAAAIKGVQTAQRQAGQPLNVWLTLPVSRNGLTADGMTALRAMLSAGVELSGVNGLTMDFGVPAASNQPQSDAVIAASKALHSQVSNAWANAGHPLNATQAWAKVGITPMIGQNDVAAERFTLADAAAVNAFARAHGVGRIAMWSLNRDGTCKPPLPSVLTVVQTSCSGIDQAGASFAQVLSDKATPAPSNAATPAATSPPAGSPQTLVDDPAHSPFPVWDPLGTYPGGTKVVWHHEVYQARTGRAVSHRTRRWPTCWTRHGPCSVPFCPATALPHCPRSRPAPTHSGAPARPTWPGPECSLAWCRTRPSGGRRASVPGPQ